LFYGICNLSIVPVRFEPSDTSEMLNQLLFGEHFTVLEKQKHWSKIQLAFDNSEGFIDNKQYEELSKETYQQISNKNPIFSGELIDFITDNKNQLTTILIGSTLPFYNNNHCNINNTHFSYDGKTFSKKLSKETILQTAFLFLNSPFLSGGKTPFGIDSSGFTQLVYKLCGYPILRKETQQATQGESLSFIEESEPGDLAFFDDAEGNIVHVGIIMKDYYIIHAYGKVRIDILDHSGIYNIETQKHTHKLRVMKKII